MILEVFDKYTRIRIDMIRTYNFVSYTRDFVDVGTFELRIPIIDESLNILNEGNYILFEKDICGIIKKKSTSVDDEEEVIVSGYLTKRFLQYRSFLLTAEYYDYASNIAKQMLNDLIINPKDKKRKIPEIYLSNDDKYFPITNSKIRVQNTGDELQSVLSEMFLSYGFGFDLIPTLTNYDEQSPNKSNISGFEFRIFKPSDRTEDNEEGNVPVVFSFELDNLSTILFEEDASDYRNVAIVAANGIGVDRNILEVGDTESSGIDRIELYVDARDLQPEEGAQIDDSKPTTSTVYSSSKVKEIVDDTVGDIGKLLDDINGEIV